MRLTLIWQGKKSTVIESYEGKKGIRDSTQFVRRKTEGQKESVREHGDLTSFLQKKK